MIGPNTCDRKGRTCICSEAKWLFLKPLFEDISVELNLVWSNLANVKRGAVDWTAEPKRGVRTNDFRNDVVSDVSKLGVITGLGFGEHQYIKRLGNR